MLYFYWNKNFETGYQRIDNQHRHLVMLINRLSEAISSQTDIPEIEEILEALADYVKLHFREEEAVLRHSSLSDLEKTEHLEQHRCFEERVSSLGKIVDLKSQNVAEHVMQMLTSWLVRHILCNDMKLAKIKSTAAQDQVPEELCSPVSPVEKILLNALNESERRFRFFCDSAPVMVWVADNRLNRTFFNKTWHGFTGHDDDLKQDRWLDLVHPDDQAAYRGFLNTLSSESANAECEYRMLHNDGQYRYLLERVVPRFETDGVFIGYIATATDISLHKQAELMMTDMNKKLEEEVLERTREIQALMLTDQLTGVGNRRFLTGRIEDELQRSDRYGHALSVLYIDIDHFKAINDRYGHGVGDTVLTRVAEKLKQEARNIDAFGRFGGEEFLAVLPETGAHSAMVIAERMRMRIAELQFDEIDHRISVSIGVAEFSSGETLQILTNKADEALYRAKCQGRNQVCTTQIEPLSSAV